MISKIENAMIAAVKKLQDDGVLGYRLKKLGSYGGEYADGLERMVKDFPAVLFAFNGATITESASRWKISCRWLAIVGAGNLRNEKSARQGDETGKVGSYHIALDIVKILGGQTFGLDISDIKPQSIEPLVNDKAGQQLVSVYGVNLSTAFYVDTLDDISTLGDFETFHANWDVPVFGNVDEDIPSDDTADATDHVTLPQ